MEDKPDDYLIATNKSHSVREFMEIAFNIIGLNWKDYLVIDERLYRPAEIYELRGAFSKASVVLGWEPKVGFKKW